MTKQIRPSVVLIQNEKVLLLKSKYSSGEFYLLPGGSMEDFETVEETSIRETKEETNYDIKITKLLYVQEWIDKKREKDVLYMVFLGEIIDGKETHLNDPCLEKGNIKGIEWVNVEKLGEITFYPKDIVPLLKKDCKQSFNKFPLFLKPSITG